MPKDPNPELDGNTSMEAPYVKIRLCDIPKLLVLKEINYNLRGLASYQLSGTRKRNSIGHYISYLRRENGLWEEANDTKDKIGKISSKTAVNIDILYYTI